MPAPSHSPLLVDAHQDIAWLWQAYGWDLRTPVEEKRRRVPPGSPIERPMLGLEECLAGRVAMVLATLFAAPFRRDRPELPAEMTYRTPLEAERLAREQLDYYRRLADEDPRIALVDSLGDLQEVFRSWEEGTPRLGLVPLLEGADPIVIPAQADQWMAAGVRIVGLAWGATRYAGGTGQPGGLSEEGRMLLKEMDRLGVILDTSHLAEEAFFQALARFNGPAIASHSNCQRLVPGDRQLSDEMIRALVEREGVVGIMLYNSALKAGWAEERGKQEVGLAEVALHVDHVCQIAGSADHVGLGSDFDGGFGSEKTPRETDSIADLWMVGPELESRGFSPEDVAKVLGGNWRRLLERCL